MDSQTLGTSSRFSSAKRITQQEGREVCGLVNSFLRSSEAVMTLQEVIYLPAFMSCYTEVLKVVIPIIEPL